MTDKEQAATPLKRIGDWKNVLVEFDEGIAWVTMNRPEKRNAMSPGLNDDMVEVLDALEIDESVGCIILTGAGESFTAGMDLREYFRAVDHLPYLQQVRARRSAWHWQWRVLHHHGQRTWLCPDTYCAGTG